MKLFTVGPVKMFPNVSKVHMNDMIYFRSDNFSSLVKDNLYKLSILLEADYLSRIIYITASGTAAMEAVITNCINKKDKAIVINGGTFGYRFCKLLEYHNIYYDSINLQWNESLTESHLSKIDGKKYSFFLVNIHETSTGQLYNIELIKNFCQKYDLLLIVDAISTFMADDFSMKKNGIDITIISSQKGLCLSPGLSFIAISERMIERCKKIESYGSKYFDFADYLSNIDRGQTPYTPAVSIMYELKAMLTLIDDNGGKQNWLSRIKEKCNFFRKKAIDCGLHIPNYPLSNMLTPIIFNNINANTIFNKLIENFNIYVNPCTGPLKEKMIRISHIGNNSIDDFDDLVKKLYQITYILK